MRIIGNIIWFLFGGIWGGIIWLCVGCFWCISIIGIPVGIQCFKFAKLAFFPFGKEIKYSNSNFSILINIFWIVFCGWEMFIGYIILGLLFCVTIVGMPFGQQFFKLARLSLLPFGAEII